MQHIEEKQALNADGFMVLVLMAVVALALVIVNKLLIVPVAVVGFIMATGFTIVDPNQGKILTFFGRYIGTLTGNGFLWTVPLSSATSVSLKFINFTTNKLKVNDLKGNPIEIAAVIVWRIDSPALAVFNVINYGAYVENQSEMIIRSTAAQYAYDAVDGASLRGNTHEILEMMQKELQEKLAIAGISIHQVRLSHLAYAPEIAAVMLRRQQAEALLSARAYLVDNALGIIDNVLDHFAAKKLTEVTDDRKMQLVSNLLVTLIADKEAAPVLNVS